MPEAQERAVGFDDFGRPISVRIYWKLLGAHVHARVFSGPGDGKRGGLGTLTMREEDWDLLSTLLTTGAVLTGLDVKITEEAEVEPS